MEVNHKCEVFREVWIISETSWKLLETLVLERFDEVLAFFASLGCDSEGNGCTVQLSGLSSSGTVSFLFVGGFLPRELAEYLWTKRPAIFDSGDDFEKSFGNQFSLSVYDPGMYKAQFIVLPKNILYLSHKVAIKNRTKP